MAKIDDQLLGTTPEDADAWRCKRIAQDGTVEELSWGEGHVRVSEWPIKQRTIETIRTRWGAGRYIVWYVRSVGNRRRPGGRSRVVELIDPPAPGAAVPVSPPTYSSSEPTPAAAPPVYASPVPSPAVPPAPAVAASPFTAMAGGVDPTGIMAFMAYVQDREERARERAAAEGRAMAERFQHDQRVMLERYKADKEFELEKLRLESEEKKAALQANARVQGRAQAPAADTSELAESMDELREEIRTLAERRSKPSEPDQQQQMMNMAMQAIGLFGEFLMKQKNAAPQVAPAVVPPATEQH